MQELVRPQNNFKLTFKFPGDPPAIPKCFVPGWATSLLGKVSKQGWKIIAQGAAEQINVTIYNHLKYNWYIIGKVIFSKCS